MNANLETLTPLADRGAIGHLSPDTVTTGRVDDFSFAPGQYGVSDAGSAMTLSFHEWTDIAQGLVADVQYMTLWLSIEQAILGMSSSISSLYVSGQISNSSMPGFMDMASMSCKQRLLPVLDFVPGAAPETEKHQEQGENTRDDNEQPGLFFDENGVRFSFAKVQVSTTDELQEEGFPFYSPSEDSPEAIESLRQILSRRAQTR